MNHFSQHFRSLPTLLAIFAASLLVNACSESRNSTADPHPTQSGLTVPRAILEARMVDQTQVFPVVRLVEDQTVIQMTPNDNNSQWTGSINVAANSQLSVNIEWFENFPNASDPNINDPLLLASLQKLYAIGNSAFSPEVTAGDSGYEFGHDDDGDSFNNLIERSQGTNPRDFNDIPDGGSPTEPGIDIEIARISPDNAPVIDGFGAIYDATQPVLIGEWASATQTGTGPADELYIDNLMIDNGNTVVDNNPFHRWAAMHDGTFLYLLVVVDDLSVNQSDNPEAHQDDSIEVYIDGDNSNFSNYGDADDRFFVLPLQELNSTAPNRSDSGNSRIDSGFGAAQLPDGVEFATGLATGPLSFESPPERHDVYELKLPLAAFGITVGSPFGIELQVNDDDDGGERDAKWGWVHPTRVNDNIDETWLDPSFMGTGVLLEQ